MKYRKKIMIIDTINSKKTVKDNISQLESFVNM